MSVEEVSSESSYITILNQKSPDIHLFLASDACASGFGAFRLELNYVVSFLKTPACIGQIVGLLSLYNQCEPLLIINLFTCMYLLPIGAKP